MIADDLTFHWVPFEEGRSLGDEGSESGVIVRDEEHPLGARITLEEEGAIAPWSITCGLYGWMAHKRFFSTREEAVASFDLMKVDLSAILEQIHREDDHEGEDHCEGVARAIEAFVDKYP